MTKVDSKVLEEIITKTEPHFFFYNVKSQSFSYISKGFDDLLQKYQRQAENFDFLQLLSPQDLSYLREAFVRLQKNEVSSLDDVSIKITGRNNESQTFMVKAANYLEDGEVLEIGCFLKEVSAEKGQSDILGKYNFKKNSALEILAHDLNGPLAFVKNITDLLEEKLTNGEGEKLLEYTGYIRELCKQSLELVSQLATNEYLEVGSSDAYFKRVNLAERINYSMAVYEQSSGVLRRNIEVQLPSKKVFAEIDEIKISVMLNNLVANSIKFTEDNGCINISLSEDEEFAILTVTDNGIGIPEKYLPVLFDRFSDARRCGLKGEASVGIGMSIVKKIVDMHHGEIRVKSAEGKGTVISIKLPKLQKK